MRGARALRVLYRLGMCGSVAWLAACATEPAGHLRYTFSWPLHGDDARAPRGGTSRGPATTPDARLHPGWVALQEEGLSDFERDRRAILAMAGPYRVSFDFLETYSLSGAYAELDVPYQSWATEYVHLVEDRGDFISLQHIMVMFFETEEGIVGPHVTKHWRQDWRFEDRDLHVYRGNRRWVRRRASESEARGRWSQAVFQVDDSPRYEALGRWVHRGNLSVWQSEPTWRPLPRREFSVRDDYQALVGINRNVITPSGWIHEQENAKRVVPPPGADPGPPHFLAREIGLNRYVRIRDHDFSAGDAYWERTGDYWRAVREVWRELYAARDELVIAGSFEGRRLFAEHFAAAEDFAADRASEAEVREEVRALLANYMSEPD